MSPFQSLYGLCQAPWAWYHRFATHLHSIGFTMMAFETSLFMLQCGDDTAWLLLYVDNIVLTACTSTLLQNIIHDLRCAFAMKDLGLLHYFLSIQVQRTVDGFFLH